MYTPPQWRTAAPPVALVAAGCAAALAYGLLTPDALAAGVGVGVGILLGLLMAMAWTLRRLTPAPAAASSAVALAILSGVWIATPPARTIALGLAVLVWAAWEVGYGVIYTGRFQRERPSELVRLGQGNGPRALVLFHSAHRGFQRRMQPLLAETLADRGWRVDLTTASRQAPADVDAYDLVVLGAPAFNGDAARPVLDYVRRARGLAGKSVALVVSGGGTTASAMRRLRRAVEAKGARVAEALELWTTAPNPPRFGGRSAPEIVRGLAASLSASVVAGRAPRTPAPAERAIAAVTGG